MYCMYLCALYIKRAGCFAPSPQEPIYTGLWEMAFIEQALLRKEQLIYFQG